MLMSLRKMQLYRIHADGTLWNCFQSLSTFHSRVNLFVICLTTDAALSSKPHFAAFSFHRIQFIEWLRLTENR